VAGLDLEVTGALLLAVVPGDAHQLPRSGEQGDIKIPFADAQFAPFNAPVAGLDPGCPRGGTRVKLVSGNLTQGGLVVLEGEEDIRPGGGGDQGRFFWQCRASPVMTAWGRTSAASSSRAWAAGRSQSSF
jgi:hypothetical protein